MNAVTIAQKLIQSFKERRLPPWKFIRDIGSLINVYPNGQVAAALRLAVELESDLINWDIELIREELNKFRQILEQLNRKRRAP